MGSFGTIIKNTLRDSSISSLVTAVHKSETASKAFDAMSYNSNSQDINILTTQDYINYLNAMDSHGSILTSSQMQDNAETLSAHEFARHLLSNATNTAAPVAVTSSRSIPDARRGDTLNYSNDTYKDTLYHLIYPYGEEEQNSDQYIFKMPEWGYEDLINERNIFVRRLSNGLDEPNWLFCRIFFNFNTFHGLLGGILNSKMTDQYKEDLIETSNIGNYNNKDGILSINTAYGYLSQLYQLKKLYSVENIEGRMLALTKFVNLLSFINTFSPWIFKGISNLNNASNINLLEPTKNNTVEIQLNIDTVDWRISTLMSLYKYACFDDVNIKEILPENLRKFDMTVVLFSMPIRYIHTPVMALNQNSQEIFRKTYKRLGWTDKNNIMSTKVYSFLGCEINTENFGSYIPANMNNEKPFQLGNSNIQINYDKVYEYMFNEYEMLLVGSDGIANINSPKHSNDDRNTLEILAKLEDRLSVGDVLVTAADIYSLAKLRSVFGTAADNYTLGNIYGQDLRIFNAFSDKSSTSITDYFRRKTKVLFGERPNMMSIGYNMFYKWLGSAAKSGTAPSADGTGTVLAGGGEVGVGTPLFYAKLKRLLEGPDKHPITDREQRRSAVANARRFDLMGWLNNKATGAVTGLNT